MDYSSLNALKVRKEEINNAKHNIANADTENYSKKIVRTSPNYTANSAQGVKVDAIITNNEPYLQQDLLSRISTLEYSKVSKEYGVKISETIGTPTNPNSLTKRINEFFVAIEELSTKPDLASSRRNAVDQIDNLLRSINNVSEDLRNYQYNIDQEINDACNELNAAIERAHILQNRLKITNKASVAYGETMNELDNALTEVATYVPIIKYKDSDNNLIIQTTDGYTLLDKFRHKLEYLPQQDSISFIEDRDLNPIVLQTIDSNNSPLGEGVEIVSGGKSGQLRYSLKEGKISALIEMRDKEILKFLDKVDNLAVNLKESTNKIHNTGSSYPGATELTGREITGRGETFTASGKARIAVVEKSGEPLRDVKGNSIPSLLLDFDKMDIGQGAGIINTQSILAEINRHFNQNTSQEKRIKVGNIDDIKLVSNSSEMAPGGDLDLDLLIKNTSGEKIGFEIDSVNAQDGSGNNVSVTNLNTDTINIESNGDPLRTGMSGPSFKLNLPDPVPSEITVSAKVKIYGKEAPYYETIHYTIKSPTEDPVNGLYNYQFSASSVNNDSGKAQILDPSFNRSILSTELIGLEDPIPISATSKEKGRIRLSTVDSDWGIVIDEMDSKLTKPGITSTKKEMGLSSYFGLNNMFVRSDGINNENEKRNTALYLSLREDIVKNPNLLASAKLQQSASTTGKPTYDYHISAGDNKVLQQLHNLSTKNIRFKNAGYLPENSSNLVNYASQVTSVSASRANIAIKGNESAEAQHRILKERMSAITGVDTDEELANAVHFQKLYASSAKTLSISYELFDILLKAF